MQGDPPSTTTPLLSENSSQIQEKSLSEPLPAGPPEKYYKRRWWILLVFSLLYAQQCNQWITFGYTILHLATLKSYCLSFC